MGVWIETRTKQGNNIPRRHTLYGCVDWNISGLNESWGKERSHPVWVCGLKQSFPWNGQVSSRHTLYGCVDWNIRSHLKTIRTLSHTLYGCVDWNSWESLNFFSSECHTLYGCVDWNSVRVGSSFSVMRHTLYGCVDWNSNSVVTYRCIIVTPCMGVWIETWPLQE